jgi:glycosyltransferase involved in cell wall biosynthesis
MRIAYVCADPGVPVFGTKGCSIHVQEILRAFARKGHEVQLFAQRTGGTPPADLAGIPIRTLPALPAADPAGLEREALAANVTTMAQLRRYGPFDLVYERYALWSFAGIVHAAQRGIPGVLEVNAPLIAEQSAHRVLVDRASAEAVARRVFGAAIAVAAVSDEVARYVRGFDILPDRVHVVPNGVDADRFSPSPRLDDPDHPFTIGFVGSLKPWHGLPDLVEAFARLRREAADIRLLIVGDGPERDPLEEDLRRRGLGHATTFTGAVSPADVPAWIARMDVAVAPYPKMEACYFSPLKVFEYMAAGRAVVGSRIGQLGSLIEEEVDGLLYTPGDTAGLAAALRRLRDEPTLRARIGDEARRRVLTSHTWAAVADRLLQLASVPTTRLEVAA